MRVHPEDLGPRDRSRRTARKGAAHPRLGSRRRQAGACRRGRHRFLGRATQLRVGRITKAHGLKGGIKLELYTDDPDRRFTPERSSRSSPRGLPVGRQDHRARRAAWYNGHPSPSSRASGTGPRRDPRSCDPLGRAGRRRRDRRGRRVVRPPARRAPRPPRRRRGRHGRPRRPPPRAGPARDRHPVPRRGARAVRLGDRARGRHRGRHRDGDAPDGLFEDPEDTSRPETVTPTEPQD